MNSHARKIVLVAGMPGSGKSIVSRAARDLGLPVLVMGDIVREEVRKRNLPPTPENMNMIAKRLREIYGRAAVAIKTVERMEEIGFEAGCVLIDGVRSLEEVEVFRGRGEVVIVAVHASPRTRFERLKKRGRPGDPSTWREFWERDMVELGFGVGNVIALADYMIVNENSIENAYASAKRVLEGECFAENKSRS